jgi:hypothetical protein
MGQKVGYNCMQIERKYFSKLLTDMKQVACATKFACANWSSIPGFPIYQLGKH